MSDYEHAAQMYRKQMALSSEMLLNALRNEHPRIIAHLTRDKIRRES
jgi:hypothetical protein